jgi:hypothetical protein
MIIIFDRKFEYHALTVFPEFVYWQLHDFAINLLQPPPGVSIENWLSVLGEIKGNYLDLRIAARGLFISVALTLYEEWVNGERALFPTLEDVYVCLRQKSIPLMSHLARYRESLENRLQMLLLTCGKSICSHRVMIWNEFSQGNWAVNLVGLPTDIQNFIISSIISQILLHRISNNLRSNKLEVLFVLDEAGPLFKRWYEQQEGTYWLSQCLAQAREYGVGFLVANQGLSDLSHSLIANTNTKILVGGAGLGSDYDTFASAVSLTPEQKEYLKANLGKGIACVKDPRYPYAFMLVIPKIS